MILTGYADPLRYERHSPGLEGDVEFYVDLARQSDPSVLDLGCGTGRITIPIAREGIPVVGIDRASAMLAVASQRGAGTASAGWVQADMRSFSLSRRFGLIFIAYRSFLHLLSSADQRACLSRVFEHLLPGGRLALNIVNPRALGLERRSGQSLVSRVERGLTVRYVFADEMAELLRNEGFEIESLYGWFDGRAFNERESSEMVWLARRPVELSSGADRKDMPS